MVASLEFVVFRMVRRAVPGRLPEMAESSPGSLGGGEGVPPPDSREVL